MARPRWQIRNIKAQPSRQSAVRPSNVGHDQATTDDDSRQILRAESAAHVRAARTRFQRFERRGKVKVASMTKHCKTGWCWPVLKYCCIATEKSLFHVLMRFRSFIPRCLCAHIMSSLSQYFSRSDLPLWFQSHPLELNGILPTSTAFNCTKTSISAAQFRRAPSNLVPILWNWMTINSPPFNLANSPCIEICVANTALQTHQLANGLG